MRKHEEVKFSMLPAGDEPEVEIAESEPEMTEEEADAFLEKGDFSEFYTPDSEMFEDLDDGEALEELERQMLEQMPEEEEEQADPELEGKLLVRDDDDGLGEALVVDIPDNSKDSASDLCR